MSTNTRGAASAIIFSTTAEVVNDRPILRLPDEASAQLPSRGQVAVTGTVGGVDLTTVLEPDGAKGHWVSVDDELWNRLNVSAGSEVEASLTPTKAWPKVTVPKDLQGALDGAPDLTEVWASLTPMARWEWVRWVKATKSADTRARRVAVTISKLETGKRRPCCFDLSSCTDPELSKNGKLLGLS